MLDFLEESFINLDEELSIKLIKRCINAGYQPADIIARINNALNYIGKEFETGEITLSDLMMSGLIYEEVLGMKEMQIQKNSVSSTYKGTILLGTIETDIHDIGKTLFKSGAILSGFKVIDIGVNVSANVFLKNIIKYQPSIVAISIILTSAIDYLKNTIEKIEQEGLRNNLKIIVGGNAMDAEVNEYVKADGFTTNINEGVRMCEEWIEMLKK
jgi:methanogenic corrinoid protein MtbC1